MKQLFVIFFFLMLSGRLLAQEWLWAREYELPAASHLRGFQLANADADHVFLFANYWDQATGLPAGCSLFKINVSGDVIWQRNFGQKLRINQVIADPQHKLLIAGDFRDTITVDGKSYISQMQTDGFLWKMDEQSGTEWFHVLSGNGAEDCHDICAISGDRYLLTGTFSDQSKFSKQTLYTNGSCGSYLILFNGQGEILQSTTLQAQDSLGKNHGQMLRRGKEGSIFLMGEYSQVKGGSVSLADENPYGAQFLARYNESLDLQELWSLSTFTDKFKSFVCAGDGLYFTGEGGWTSGSWMQTIKLGYNGRVQWRSKRGGFKFHYSARGIAPGSEGFYVAAHEANPQVPAWTYSYALMIPHYNSDGEESCRYFPASGAFSMQGLIPCGKSEYMVAGYTPDTISLGDHKLYRSRGNIFLAKFRDLVQTSGDADAGISNAVIVSPNPSDGRIHLRLPKWHAGDRLEVYNALGALVKTAFITSQTQEVDLAGLEPAVYVLVIMAGNEKRIKKLIIE